ncbi:glutaredoxin 3 [Anoxynatronum buryatiense]|uniref:Glutaredoxin n=1 Tax=Anoxynatronum buryatiense TaxID=489973 RepID=A0AA46AHC0_9CLOT|nr:glutaredoxin 3 [Anoxynatronum buryatiense]SMP38516.1 glutaredoxin 3 [Anoxynatronum buryatiense]
MKKVEVYCWTYCPYCIRAMQLLDQEGVAYEKIVIDGDNESMNKLKARTGSGTVPQIFVEDQFIGGCDDLMAIKRQGKWDSLFL